MYVIMNGSQFATHIFIEYWYTLLLRYIEYFAVPRACPFFNSSSKALLISMAEKDLNQSGEMLHMQSIISFSLRCVSAIDKKQKLI